MRKLGFTAVAMLLAPAAAVGVAQPAGATPVEAAGAGPSSTGRAGATAAGAAQVSAAPAAVAARLGAEARQAAARLPANAQLPHPGRAEALTHPGSDGLSAGRLTGTVTAGHLAAGPLLAAGPRAGSSFGPAGIDVSAYQGAISWSRVVGRGNRFAIVKATEATYYTSPDFAQQYNGSYAAGMIRGAYTFAVPNNSSGAAQADYFVAHGGGWTAGGRTLPGMLDIEYNPYGAECYGLTHAQMSNWVRSFDNEYHRLTGRMPILYTNASWWNACTGGSAVAAQDPLDVAAWGPSPSPLPGGWGIETIWQYTDSNGLGYDGDRFNGSLAGLTSLAAGHPVSAGTGGGTGTGGAAPGPGGGPPGILQAGRTLAAGHQLVAPNHLFRLVMQGDGNLVVYNRANRPLWATDTVGHAGNELVMQRDGNLVVYATQPVQRALWSSGTAGRGPSQAGLLDTGNFVVSRLGAGLTWQTHTGSRG